MISRRIGTPSQRRYSVIHTNLTPIKRVATTIKERLATVVSYCVRGIASP